MFKYCWLFRFSSSFWTHWLSEKTYIEDPDLEGRLYFPTSATFSKQYSLKYVRIFFLFCTKYSFICYNWLGTGPDIPLPRQRFVRDSGTCSCDVTHTTSWPATAYHTFDRPSSLRCLPTTHSVTFSAFIRPSNHIFSLSNDYTDLPTLTVTCVHMCALFLITGSFRR
jgi:hypothetical protein